MTYNIPTVDEVAALIVGNFDSFKTGRDIIVRKNDGQLQRIYEANTTFILHWYAFLILFGEDGHQEDIPISGFINNYNNFERIKVTWRSILLLEFKKEKLNMEISWVLEDYFNSFWLTPI